MRCTQQDSILRFFEGVLDADAIAQLQAHLEQCKRCRKDFIALQLAGLLADGETSEAPEGFAQATMERIRAVREPAQIAMSVRLLWGISAVFIGLALFAYLNPAIGTGLLGNAISAIGAAMGFAQSVISRIELANLVPAQTTGIFALVFVAVIGVLIYVLQNQEANRAR